MLLGSVTSLYYLCPSLVDWLVCQSYFPKRAGSYTALLLSEHLFTDLDTFCQVCLKLKKHFPLLCKSANFTAGGHEYFVPEIKELLMAFNVQNYIQSQLISFFSN